MASTIPHCKNLVLDAGPLLSLSPLRGLAETYYTVPQVISELKDPRARAHFEQLGLLSGVNIKIQAANPVNLAYIIQQAKKTGDYTVLSHADLCVLALTYELHEAAKAAKLNAPDESIEASPKAQDATTSEPSSEPQRTTIVQDSPVDEVIGKAESLSLHDEVSAKDNNSAKEAIPKPDSETEETSLEPLEVELESLGGSQEARPKESEIPDSSEPLYDDPSDDDDGEGEWITPSNVGIHKSKALNLLPDTGSKGKKKEEFVDVGCMSADFAMQNVLLQSGLNLVGLEGKRIQKVKTWVLRCHACFKLCKDNSKKFCPSCGNPTLIRASVTVSAPNAAADAPVMQVHLKPNFQYRIRGTKYSIPQPKAGSAKTGAGHNLILREDQPEYMKARKKLEAKQEREEAKMLKGILYRGVDGNAGATGLGSWMDPDWIPEMMSVGAGGKGRTTRSSGMDGDLPQIGYGKMNPNARRKRK